MSQAPSSVLIVAPNWVGDMVMAQSLFKKLVVQRSDCRITVLAPEWTRSLTSRMPEVWDTISFRFAHGEFKLRDRYRFALKLRRRGFTQVIVLPNSFKSALIPYWAHIPRRTGFLGEFRYGLLNDIHNLDRKRLPMTVQRFVALGLPVDDVADAVNYEVPKLVPSASGIATALTRLGLAQPTRPLLALCPGAEYGPAKRWPVEHFSAIAQRFHDRGWIVWLFGSNNDITVTAAIGRQAPAACVDLAGRTRLDEAIDLLSLADTVLTNDSGLMHVATALERKVIALFGSSSPEFTPPLGSKAEILRLGLDCSPCFKRECPLGHLRCLRDLTPDRIAALISEP